MSTTKLKYYNRVIDGYLCTFKPDNHLCVDVMLATGMNIENWKKFSEKMIGQIDPKYNAKKRIVEPP